MSYINHPYGGNCYEAERATVIPRDLPYGGSYRSASYGVDGYGTHVPQHREVITEVVTDVVPSDYHYGRPTEIIERREERIVDGTYDPYRRMY